MARSPLLLGGLLGLLLAGGLAAVACRRPLDTGPVYSVAQVQAGLADHPQAWVGRTVHLRAIAEPCPLWGTPEGGLHCASAQPVLVDQTASLTASLALTWRPQGPLLALLRGVPLLGDLVPAPRVPAWMAAATYHVQLRGVPAPRCGYSPCFQALLLDAAPDAPGGG
jgi:hypothetical protein